MDIFQYSETKRADIMSLEQTFLEIVSLDLDTAAKRASWNPKVTVGGSENW